MNDLKRNKINLPIVTINTKFLNCLQPEWLKYVISVCLARNLITVPYDDFFDYLQQYEKLVIASRAKKLEKTHDPLALIAHSSSSSPTFSTREEEELDCEINLGPSKKLEIYKIRVLEKERAALQMTVSELQKHILELQNAQSVLKRQMNTNEDTYLDDVLNLEAKLKINENVVIKMSQSVQAMFILGPKPLLFYDPKFKHGLGYENPYTLKKAISQNPKLYDASTFQSSKVHMNVHDTEEILEDETKS
ncbi:hypothetical protein Tco_1273421 [Tanacetum coccineum]